MENHCSRLREPTLALTIMLATAWGGNW